MAEKLGIYLIANSKSDLQMAIDKQVWQSWLSRQKLTSSTEVRKYSERGEYLTLMLFSHI